MSSADQQSDVRAAIVAATTQFIDAVRQQDAAGCARLYTADGATLPPNADIARGQAAIHAVYQAAFDAGLTDFAVESLEVESAGDLAYEMGRYRMSAGEDLADEGKYILIWKREAGQWRIHRDIINTSQPA